MLTYRHQISLAAAAATVAAAGGAGNALAIVAGGLPRPQLRCGDPHGGDGSADTEPVRQPISTSTFRYLTFWYRHFDRHFDRQDRYKYKLSELRYQIVVRFK